MSYELIPAIGTQCTCGEQPWLLCPERSETTLPAFYLCGFCGRVAQVGVGLITRRLTSLPPDACGGGIVGRESNLAAGAGEDNR